MRINFLVNEVTGGWEPTDTRLGGTEEAVREWAKELARRGHEIYVYRNFRESPHIVRDKVAYLPREEYFEDLPGDICINIKSSEVAPKEPTLYYTNETNASELDLSKYLGVIHISEWSLENIPVNNPRKFILPHGYDDTKIYPGKKIRNQCLYASSPDRGLDTLLRAWLSAVPTPSDATLIVTYGAAEYDIPGVKFLGEVDEETMNQLYRESDIWAYPCNGGELYCATGLKAQAAGCVPVIIPTMALEETVRDGIFVKHPEDYAKALINTLGDEDLKQEIRDNLAQEKFPNWQDSTDRLLEIIGLVLK